MADGRLGCVEELRIRFRTAYQLPGIEIHLPRFGVSRLYPRMVEIVQQIGASGLVTLPTSEDLDGPLRADIDKYFQSARLDAADKIDLYRLAWDASVSAFAGRQVLYERFFFGDPAHMATRIFRNNPCSDLMERVNQFIHGK